MTKVMTVTGPIEAAALGKTLMHEHLAVGFAGWEVDSLVPRQTRREMIAVCVDRIEELKSHGYRSLVDPCPNDVGRDVELMGEVAARTGFNIIAATGLYNEALGANAYWRTKALYDPDFVDRLADLFVHELTEGMPGGAKAGIIKLATGVSAITAYEEKVFRAGAKAALAAGAPITTHTDAVLGDAQLVLLTRLGVPASRIVIGHCCGSSDHQYHMGLVEGGAYVGFDRFGIESICSDDDRIAALLKLLKAGANEHMIISHDSICCLHGQLLPLEIMQNLAKTHTPLRFERYVAPKLRAAGVTPDQIEALLVQNPRRYFEGLHAPERNR